MKLDLRWDYNNMWIKEGNKWKVAFITPKGSFKPTVIFFGLINLPVIFQTMMNEILCDLINTGEVASFIDNIIVGTEEEERYNKVVEEVVKRLVENDSYIKIEKCKQKIRKVGFLEVVRVGDDGLHNFLFSLSDFYFILFLFLKPKIIVQYGITCHSDKLLHNITLCHTLVTVTQHCHSHIIT